MAGSGAGWGGFKIDVVGVRERWVVAWGFCGMDVEGVRILGEETTGFAVVGMGEGVGGGTVVVAVSKLIWLVGGDVRRMLIVVGVVVVCLTAGRTVLLLLLIGCGVAMGILFKREGFCRARLFLRAAMLAGLEI